MFSPHPFVQTGCGVQPDSYPMHIGVSIPGIKRPGRESDHSPPSRAKVKNAWSYNSTPPYVFMTWYLDKHRNNFTFAFTLISTYITGNFMG
jgi:hypothetical protein